MNSSGCHPGDESDKYVGASAATTVLRKTIHQRYSNPLDGLHPSNSIDQNHKTLLNNSSYEQSMRLSTSSRGFSSQNSNPSGQQCLLTSGDIEAMTMKQFRMGSLGC